MCQEDWWEEALAKYSSQFHKKMCQKKTKGYPPDQKTIIISTPFPPRNIGCTSSTALSTSILAYGGIGCKKTRLESKTDIMGRWGSWTAAPSPPGRTSAARPGTDPRPPLRAAASPGLRAMAMGTCTPGGWRKRPRPRLTAAGAALASRAGAGRLALHRPPPMPGRRRTG
jgi:hypothetical protein